MKNLIIRIINQTIETAINTKKAGTIPRVNNTISGTTNTNTIVKIPKGTSPLSSCVIKGHLLPQLGQFEASCEHRCPQSVQLPIAILNLHLTYQIHYTRTVFDFKLFKITQPINL